MSNFNFDILVSGAGSHFLNGRYELKFDENGAIWTNESADDIAFLKFSQELGNKWIMYATVGPDFMLFAYISEDAPESPDLCTGWTAPEEFMGTPNNAALPAPKLRKDAMQYPLLVLSGAGSSQVNGKYFKNGMSFANGKEYPSYSAINGEHKISFDSIENVWNVVTSNWQTVFYIGTGETPNVATWSAIDGTMPVPTVEVDQYRPFGSPSPHRTVSVTKGIKKFVKDPDSVENYTLDWTDKYNETEETIMSEFIIPEGLSVEYEIFTGKLSTVWLSGGEVNKRYGVTNRVTTNEGRVYDKSIVIECQHQ